MAKKEHKTNRIALRPFVLISVMLLITVIGMFIFKMVFLKNNIATGVSSGTEYERYYAIITEDGKSEYWQDIYAGAMSEGMESDSYVEMFADNMGGNYSVVEKMNIAISSDVDGIIIEGSDNYRVKEKINEASAKGIPVVTVSQDASGCDRISFIGVSNYELSQKYGKETCDLATKILENDPEKQKVNVMVLTSDNHGGNGQNLLLSGIKEALSGNKELGDRVALEVVGINDSGSFTAEEAIRDLFVGNDVKPDILVCLSYIHTTCAAQAVVDYNCVGQTNIIGAYDSELILNNIEKDVIYSTISMDVEQMGRYCVNALNEFHVLSYANDYYSVDTYIVNSGNISQYVGGADEKDN